MESKKVQKRKKNYMGAQLLATELKWAGIKQGGMVKN